MTPDEAAAAVDAVFTTIRDDLARGERVEIRGFGSFEVRRRTARQGEDPVTGERTTLPARAAIRFRPAQELREVLEAPAS